MVVNVGLFSKCEWDKHTQAQIHVNIWTLWEDKTSHKFLRMSPMWRWPEITNGETTHQVDIENRSVITVYVHIHGALLWSEADSVVLQGKRGAGCNVISETEKDIFILTCVVDGPESLLSGSKAVKVKHLYQQCLKTAEKHSLQKQITHYCRDSDIKETKRWADGEQDGKPVWCRASGGLSWERLVVSEMSHRKWTKFPQDWPDLTTMTWSTWDPCWESIGHI